MRRDPRATRQGPAAQASGRPAATAEGAVGRLPGDPRTTRREPSAPPVGGFQASADPSSRPLQMHPRNHAPSNSRPCPRTSHPPRPAPGSGRRNRFPPPAADFHPGPGRPVPQLPGRGRNR
ncbi:hypothetical protein ACE1SV_27180 [Streptomyces sennicomposti]